MSEAMVDLSTSKDLLLFDRSRTTCDWGCPRRRYLQYEYNGRGIVSGHTSLELFLGISIHDSLAAIASQHMNGGVVDIDLIATTAKKQMMDSILEATSGEVSEVDFAEEQGTLAEGLLRGFYRHMWPKLLAAYPTIISIEQEMTYKVDERLIFMSKPDLVMADVEGNWHYIEYKSTASKNENWMNSWNSAIQLHSTIRAIEETLGKAPVDVTVVGLYKGYSSYGKQNSPMCYAYKRTGTPPFSKDEIQYNYKAGFKRYPVWEMEGGVKAWVEGMPDEIIADQYPCTPPLFIKDDMVNNFFQQRLYREHEIELANQMLEATDDAEAKAEILNATYPQKFDACNPWMGRACSYSRICHSHVENPLESGWTYRESHHQLEVEQDSHES